MEKALKRISATVCLKRLLDVLVGIERNPLMSLCICVRSRFTCRTPDSHGGDVWWGWRGRLWEVTGLD